MLIDFNQIKEVKIPEMNNGTEDLVLLTGIVER